ncbi:N-acetyl-gamma-glutamyl-phosphate reductase [Thaumasiovibrio subtropicus]|uniref:N-acetyl-gamma-glutamyl-phosphate reductase n=1 Tax=Thaumasiovibrio subtropicus TaxID=1891207 RepID=UPI000B3519A8|nr:N-acetyl-gamma-glutamyl-phosphate reductase [Thaumasiovibrio subtropicus]
MYKVFIDGEEGTTGLQIKERLANHNQIELVSIDPAQRKNDEAKKTIMEAVDLTVLCLPDEAAKSSAKLAASVGCRVLDASSAHRIADGWVYGMPELNAEQRDKIKSAQHVSNPGCYATGAILLLKPVINLIDSDNITINAVSGYSGGGKNMIAHFEEHGEPFGLYGLNMNHKHIPEITQWANLTAKPIFIPSVANYAQGMLVCIPVQNRHKTPIHVIEEQYRKAYANEDFINFHGVNRDYSDQTFSLATPQRLNGTNQVDIEIFSSDEDRFVLVARLDNLGKGASGAAVQNLNLMLGLEESTATAL